MSVIQ
jgi:hypothetical protein